MDRAATWRYRSSMFSRLIVMFAALFALAAPATGDDTKTPYWASIRAGEVNMRVGPGEDYKVNWVYRRPLLPVKVLRLKEGWRFVEDPDGAKGWMLARFLVRERTAIVSGQGNAPMRESGSAEAKQLWQVEPGVVGKLGDCSEGWCAFTTGAHRGFIEQSRLWGAGEP
jgi:SH3-like domain-containing protein